MCLDGPLSLASSFFRQCSAQFQFHSWGPGQPAVFALSRGQTPLIESRREVQCDWAGSQSFPDFSKGLFDLFSLTPAINPAPSSVFSFYRPGDECSAPHPLAEPFPTDSLPVCPTPHAIMQHYPGCELCGARGSWT